MSDCNKPIEFNLLDEGWIRVLLPDCTVREVSLPDALIHAHEYVDLAGEMPTQDVAVLRLLLAVLHTVFSRVDPEGESDPLESTGEALRRWKVLWEAGQFPEKPIREYLNEWRDRFWLFHPERPFWQVPEDEMATGYSAAKLNGEILKSEHKDRLFMIRNGVAKDELSYSEAARWLLTVNGYDDASGKVSKRNRGVTLPATGVGWLGKIGVITAIGENLFETLMMNLTFCYNETILGEEDHPCWEDEFVREEERIEISIPDNFAALLTLQSRRIHLIRSNNKVSSYELKGGDVFSANNAFIETMTSWRKTEDKGSIVYIPKLNSSATQMWREFPGLFSFSESTDVRSGLVKWLAKLQKNNAAIAKNRFIRFRTIGVEYDGSNSSIANVFSDSLSLHVEILAEAGWIWQRRITAELALCEKAAFEIKRLAKCINQAAGNDKGGSPERAEEQFYDRLNLPFRLWLEQIDPDEQSDMDPICAQWRDTAFRIASELGRELISQAGPAAVIGRLVKEGKKGKEESVYRSAPDAYNYFRYKIAKTFKIQKEENR